MDHSFSDFFFFSSRIRTNSRNFGVCTGSRLNWGFLLFLYGIFLVLEIEFIQGIVRYIDEGEDLISEKTAYLYATGVVCCALGVVCLRRDNFSCDFFVLF